LRLAICACLQDAKWTNTDTDKRRTRRTFGVIN
jgi:hypothetical protein